MAKGWSSNYGEVVRAGRTEKEGRRRSELVRACAPARSPKGTYMPGVSQEQQTGHVQKQGALGENGSRVRGHEGPQVLWALVAVAETLNFTSR